MAIGAHPAHGVSRSPSSPMPYSPCGCSHGGTRNCNTSLRLQTWSVNPAAIAGVHGRHNRAEPLPVVASGISSVCRKLAWGRTKLW
jgi:hypothetical protein